MAVVSDALLFLHLAFMHTGMRPGAERSDLRMGDMHGLQCHADLVSLAFQLYLIGLHDLLNANISQTCINSSLLNACSQTLSDHAPQKMNLGH